MYGEAPRWKVLFRWIEVIVGFNIIIVDILLMQYLMQKKSPVKTQTIIHSVEIPQKQTNVVTSVPTITLSPVNLNPPVQQSGVKDYYIPFGTGQSTAIDWADVPGLQAFISSGSYPHIKQIVFEASIQVPTANQTAWVRLFDVSAQHPVWFSDMYFSGGASPQYLISQPIQLGTGNDLYQVQMKTQLGSPALLLQSRIHITLE